MRPDIPWNVAGIPPEAREAARAAARREGLSVGEWMTRRILRSFSDTPDDMTPAREQWTSNGGGYAAQPEARPAATRRDTDDMLAHVARSESESNEIYRRIEEQLRNVARRLESTERNTSENNRAMSKAASEINVAAREQAQAFDQLGGSVMGLADRLERVERTSANDGMRDAVKGLHQGLSRLADQITTTANQSASQISSMANNLEALAGRLAQARTESETTTRTFEQRMSHFDDRMRTAERATQASHDAVSHTLESIEARKDEEAAALRRDAETASAIARLEDNFTKLETLGPDPSIDRRLSGIERSLSDIVGRFEAPAHADAVEDNIKRLAQRIETAESRQREQVAELRAAMNDASGHIAAAQPVAHTLTGGGQNLPFALPASFDVPPFPDTTSPEQQAFQTSADPFASAPTFDPSGAAFGAEAAFANAGYGADPFALAPPPPPPPDSYLSAARRSARAAAARAESERGSRWSGFSWGAATTDPAAPTKSAGRKTYVWIAIIALLAIFAVAAGAILSQKLTATSTHTVGALFNKSNAGEPTARHPASDVLPPIVGGESSTPSAQAVTISAAAPGAVNKPVTRAPAPSGVKPLETHVVKPAPVHAVPRTASSAPASATALAAAATPPHPAQPANVTPLDKLTALANSGNAKAELVVGLKYLDGDGVVVNETDAAKWLERAAEQGMAVAQYRLGTMYERGRGVPADATKAVKWYMLAAQAGNRKAMHNLAVAYASGTGTAKNLAEAARWFSKAAALGLSDSQFNLAVLYERGLGVPQSLLDAYKWYAIAAAGGDTESKARIDALTTQLSADDRAAAQHAANSFHAQPLDPRSNVVPQMSDVAG